MTRPDDISLDDLLFDLHEEGVEPTHANLLALIDRYPQHRDALVAYFAAAGADLGPDEEAPAPNVEHIVNRGVSRALNLMHGRRLAPGPRGPAPHGGNGAPRLSALAARRALTLDDLAQRTGLHEVVVLKLDRRRIRPPTAPWELFDRLGDALGIPAAEVIASATGPPVAASAGRFMKAKGPLVRNTESFREAVEGSPMPDDAKARWLALAPLGDDPDP